MAHYFSKQPKSELRLKEIRARLRGNELVFYTASSVFSPDEIDTGSKVLIENVIIKDGWDILDLGCAYGAIGISIAKAFPNARVVMSDINERAVMLCKKNIQHNKVDNAVCVAGEMYQAITGKFDTILLNPPFHAGKDICIKMIIGARDYLKQDGILQIVARHKKGGASLAREMESVFGNCSVLARESGFKVYASKKSAD